MAYLNYQTTITGDTTLINLGLNADGLIIDGQKITTGAPDTTSNKYISSCMIQSIADGITYQNIGTSSSPSWVIMGSGAFALPITTVLSSGVATYDQTNNFLGIGLSGAGQTFDTGSGGLNIIASFDVSPFGGPRDFTAVGYFNPFGAGNANMQFQYDSVVGNAASDLMCEDSTGNHSAHIRTYADSGTSQILFRFNNTDFYFFPTTTPNFGDVLTAGLGGVLTWQASGGGTPAGANQAVQFNDGGSFGGNASNFYWDKINNDFGVGNPSLTFLTVSNLNSNIVAQVDGQFQIQDAATSLALLNVDVTGNKVISFGDINGAVNDTRLNLTVGTQTLFWKATNLLVNNNNGDSFMFAEWKPGLSNRYIDIGDYSATQNKTKFEINDFAKQVFVQTDGTFAVQSSTGKQLITTDDTTKTVKIGDASITGNGNRIVIDDVAETIRSYISGEYVIEEVAGGAYFSVFPTGRLVSIGDYAVNYNGTFIKIDDINQLVKISNVPTYADDAAAIVGGLNTGNLYKTTTGGITSLNIVP